MPSLRRTRSGALHAFGAALVVVLAGAANAGGATAPTAPTVKPIEPAQTSIAPRQARVLSLRAGYDAARSQLVRVRTESSGASARLAQAQTIVARTDTTLSQQLVSRYESDRPDVVSVVLGSHGLPDLLEQISFARRLQDEEAALVAHVRAARAALSAQAIVLGGLQVREQAITSEFIRQRNEFTEPARSQPSSGDRFTFPIANGGDRFTFPIAKGAASPPTTWTVHDGVEISAPADTPELAVGPGTIALHGVGGFGPWATVLHLDSGRYLYYGNAGPGRMLPIGTHVTAGQVIGEVGAGIVGISSGPHLEIGYCDASGTPLGPQTGSRLLALLRASY